MKINTLSEITRNVIKDNIDPAHTPEQFITDLVRLDWFIADLQHDVNLCADDEYMAELVAEYRHAIAELKSILGWEVKTDEN